MKRKLLQVLAIIAMLLFALVSCDDGSGGGGKGREPDYGMQKVSEATIANASDIEYDDALAAQYPGRFRPKSEFSAAVKAQFVGMSIKLILDDTPVYASMRATWSPGKYYPFPGDSVTITVETQGGESQVHYTGKVNSFENGKLSFTVTAEEDAATLTFEFEMDSIDGSLRNFRSNWIDENDEEWPIKVKLSPKRDDDSGGEFTGDYLLHFNTSLDVLCGYWCSSQSWANSGKWDIHISSDDIDSEYSDEWKKASWSISGNTITLTEEDYTHYEWEDENSYIRKTTWWYFYVTHDNKGRLILNIDEEGYNLFIDSFTDHGIFDNEGLAKLIWEIGMIRVGD